jgi:hypothetical protein
MKFDVENERMLFNNTKREILVRNLDVTERLNIGALLHSECYICFKTW